MIVVLLIAIVAATIDFSKFGLSPVLDKLILADDHEEFYIPDDEEDLELTSSEDESPELLELVEPRKTFVHDDAYVKSVLEEMSKGEQARKKNI